MNGDIELPGYTIEKEIGRGGMSRVYYAHQHNFDIFVALKIMDTSLLGNPDFEVRFFEEARTMKRLHHPNIVGVNDVGMHGHYFYLSMEYLEGGSLKDRIKDGMSPQQCLKIISDMAAALDYIHRRGFVHRDIKPENVLFRTDGSAVITDFGISRAVEGTNHLTKTNMVIGTPNYMSPEQAKGVPIDFRSDIYSVGVLLFEMLTGELPYKGTSSVAVGVKHIIDPLPELRGPNARFQKVVNRAMAKLPTDRYSNCGELEADFKRAMQNSGSDAVEKAANSSTRGMPQMLGGGAHALHSFGRTVSTLIGAIAAPVMGMSGRNFTVLAAAVIAVGVIAGGYVFWPESGQSVADAAAGTQTRASTPTAPAIPDATIQQNVPADPEVDVFADDGYPIATPELEGSLGLPVETVAEVLLKASTYLNDNALTTPQGANAYESYQQVLVMDPTNSEALAGITLIVEKYKQLAEARMETQDYSGAKSLVNRAIRIAPTNTELPEFLNQINEAQSQQEAAQRQEKINQLLAQGAERVRSGDLVTPDQDSALFYYQQVLDLDPGNAAATTQIRQAGSQLIPEINLQISLGQFDEASQLIGVSEQLYAGNPLLNEPRKRNSDLREVAGNSTGPRITEAGLAKPSLLGQIFSKDDGKRLSMSFNYEGFREGATPLTLRLLDGDRKAVLATETVELNGRPARKVVNFQQESDFGNGWYEMDVLSGDRFLRTLRFELVR